MGKKPMCRHCAKHTAHRPLGLCWACWYAPEINKLYKKPAEEISHEEVAARARRLRDAIVAKNLRGGEPHLTRKELREVLP